VTVIVVAALGFSGTVVWAQARVNQERCYQSALVHLRPRAAGLDWSRTPAGDKLALLDAALASSPECAYIHYLRGVVLDGDMGKTEEALRAFEKAVEIVPTFDLAHENIALVHRAEARRSFGQPELRPETKDDVFHLTRALAALKQASEVVAANRLWGRERTERLLGLAGELERELAEVKSPEGNADFLAGKLTEFEVIGWRANIRAGFGLDFPVQETLKRGDGLKAASGHRRYGWIKVRLSDGRPGWVYYNLVK
jgi:hypothetical protein